MYTFCCPRCGRRFRFPGRAPRPAPLGSVCASRGVRDAQPGTYPTAERSGRVCTPRPSPCARRPRRPGAPKRGHRRGCLKAEAKMAAPAGERAVARGRERRGAGACVGPGRWCRPLGRRRRSAGPGRGLAQERVGPPSGPAALRCVFFFLGGVSGPAGGAMLVTPRSCASRQAARGCRGRLWPDPRGLLTRACVCWRRSEPKAGRGHGGDTVGTRAALPSYVSSRACWP